MKRYITLVVCTILLVITFNFLYYQGGFYLGKKTNVTSDFAVKEKTIYVNNEAFEIRGVDMGTGGPGKWSTEFAIEKDTYAEWFKLIKEMGANTVRVYTINPTDFYDAFYEYNKDNPDPLYLIQGVWVDENAMNSHIDGFDEEFIDEFIIDCKMAVDVIHGSRTIQSNEVNNIAKGNFRKDISKWVIGYIVGVEWESSAVSYTNDLNANNDYALPYVGSYLYTQEEASPFENMLARVGDTLLEYESNKYGKQRLIAFSNWPNTDPFEYPEEIKKNMKKFASIDVEHIKQTEKVIAGQFASYHVYPYYPNYINYLDDWSIYGIEEPKDYLEEDMMHSYEAYLSALVNHHSMPVVISEYGVPSSRGIAAIDTRQAYNHGALSEDEQAQIVLKCYQEIMEAGCAGSCVFSWQDEWFKRAWNTLYANDNKRTVYWSDYQTIEQSFGVLGYDTGYKNNCYNDDSITEWKQSDLVSSNDNLDLYMTNDEKYIYFRIHNKQMDFTNDTYYIPIDVTPKSGSKSVINTSLSFDRDADFLIKINGFENSELLVQERYEALLSNYSNEVYGYDAYLLDNAPSKDSNKFVSIKMVLQEPVTLIYGEDKQAPVSTYVTGKLKYGNGNPNSENYVSNSDYYCSGQDIEIRIPYSLLNFADPSLGEIHDDYYDNFGVSYLNIDSIYAGVTLNNDNKTVELKGYELNTWNETIDAEPYLKQAYYTLQAEWQKSDKYISNKTSKQERTVNVSVDYSVPALMYHDFKEDGSVDESELGEYAIYASEFESDLKYLKDNGYTSLNTADLLAIKAGTMEMPAKPVILTIDDGRYGVYNVAYPLLQKYEMKAVLSTIGLFLDEETIAASKDPKSKQYRTFSFCTWDEVNEMVSNGAIEVISHSYEMHDLEEASQMISTNGSNNIITSDVLQMKDTFVRRNVTNTVALAYPFSIRNRQTDQNFFEMGYTTLYTGDIYTIRNDLNYTYTSKYGVSDKTYLIPRVSRLHGTGIAENIKYFNSSVYNVVHYG